MNNNAWFKKENPFQTVIGYGGGATGFQYYSSSDTKTYVDDVFSTYLYRGNGNTTKIKDVANGIKLGTSQAGASTYFNGTDDQIDYSDETAWDFGSGDFTIECWAKVNSINNFNDAFVAQWVSGQYCFYFGTFQQDFRLFWSTDGSAESNLSSGYTVTTGGWHHYAASRSGDSLRLFVDGVQKGSTQDMSGVTLHNSTTTVVLGNNADVGDGSRHLNGSLSNVRIIKGTGLYTSDFSPLMSDLTNVTNTKLLCCQSNSSTTAATVIPSGDSITANGNPTASSKNITIARGNKTITWPSTIKWNDGSAPTLNESYGFPSDANVITLLTRDEGVTWYGWENSSVSGGYEMWAWGRNNNGMLGDNSTVDKSSPVQVGGAVWSAVARGYYGSSVGLGVKSDGTLWVWGTSGESLGQNVSPGNASYSSPTQIGSGTDWSTNIVAGSCMGAVKTDGSLWTWGSNHNGKLGHNQGTAAAKSSPTQIPGTWSTTSGTLTSGYGNMACIRANGELYTWGGNNNKSLGLSLIHI